MARERRKDFAEKTKWPDLLSSSARGLSSESTLLVLGPQLLPSYHLFLQEKVTSAPMCFPNSWQVITRTCRRGHDGKSGLGLSFVAGTAHYAKWDELSHHSNAVPAEAAGAVPQEPVPAPSRLMTRSSSVSPQRHPHSSALEFKIWSWRQSPQQQRKNRGSGRLPEVLAPTLTDIRNWLEETSLQW